MHLAAETVEAYIREAHQQQHGRAQGLNELQALVGKTFICCPEDHMCGEQCRQSKSLCLDCQIPICSTCQTDLQAQNIVPQSLANDNWYGYVQEWVYKVGVTWMEKTVASPFWTGLTLFTVRQL